jgi:pimeloyl-ACP methyl ester carboxylesterase
MSTINTKMSTQKTFMKSVGNMMLIVLAVILCAVLALAAWLLLLSPGTIEPYRDQTGAVPANSISEKTYETIGGVRQGMFIRGADKDNPVLLFLHGGPGMPTYFLTRQFPTGLEDHFTVCYWEQRDAGISYNPDLSAGSLTVEQLMQDTIEVTNYLRERFGQEKIYLMGHSWGSFIGLQVAATAPELYHAYIGVAQVTNQLQSEQIAYQWMLEQYQAAGETKKMEKLRAYPILTNPALTASWFKTPERDAFMHELGIGTTRNMKDVYTGIFFPFLGTREYTLAEKYNTFFRAKPFLRNETGLIESLLSTDLSVEIPRLEIPAYFMSGGYDMTVNVDLSRAYTEQLQAPLKGYYLFNESAHCPMHEESDRFLQIMLEDVLKGTNALADIQ